MDMSKYKSLFLSETGEHLDALEGELLQLEQHPGDTARIHEAFRHLHSVKGMAGSMGYDGLARLAHRLEDLMAHHRELGSPVTPEEVDLLLRGLDALRSRLRELIENRPPEEPPEELLRAADEIIQRGAREKPPATVSRPVLASPPPPAKPAGDGKPHLTYQVEATVAAGASLPAMRAFLVYKRLSEIGQVTETIPDIEEVRAGHIAGRTLALKLQCNLSLAEIRQVTGAIPELERVEIRPLSEPPPAAAPPPAPSSGPATVRVRTDLLDFFMDAVGELITERSHFEALADHHNIPALREGVRRLTSVVRRLHDRVIEVRMVPVSLLTQRLPRVCRDIAHSRGKEVRFTVEGEEVQLDRAVVEALDNPILHLLRNAVDHGIETPEERRMAGKPEEGRVHLAVRRQHDRVEITLSDDGCGIDPATILARAQALGLRPPAPEGKPVSDPEALAAALEIIFLPGFSTREGASEISGRGVGLDVVRGALHQLSGRVTVNSAVGRGTSFILDLPLTLAILQVLLVEVGQTLLALPASRVLRAMAVHPEQLPRTPLGGEIGIGPQTFPYADLQALLDPTRRGQQPGCAEVVVVGEADRPALAIGVDRVSGHIEAVLKKVGPLLRSLGPFSAGTVLGDGRPVLILDTDALIQFSQPRQEN